jgi:hypothetical protein
VRLVDDHTAGGHVAAKLHGAGVVCGVDADGMSGTLVCQYAGRDGLCIGKVLRAIDGHDERKLLARLRVIRADAACRYGQEAGGSPVLHVDAGHGDHLIDVAGDHVAVELAVLEQGGLQLVRVGLIEHAAAGSVQFLHELS